MRMIPVLLAAALTLPALVRAEDSDEAGDWDARITAVSGRATLFTGDEKEGMPAEEGMPVESGDHVQTGKDGTVEIAFAADNVVEVGPDSMISVESIDKSDSWLSLDLGRMVAKLRKLLRRERFGVRTPTAVAGVRGTEFGVVVAKDGESTVGVLYEGEVGVRAIHAPDVEETIVTKKREVRVPHEDPDIKEKDGKLILKLRRWKRVKKHRKRIKHLRKRHEILTRTWKSMTRHARKSHRQKARRKHKQRMKNMSPSERRGMKRTLQRRSPGKGRGRMGPGGRGGKGMRGRGNRGRGRGRAGQRRGGRRGGPGDRRGGPGGRKGPGGRRGGGGRR